MTRTIFILASQARMKRFLALESSKLVLSRCVLFSISECSCFNFRLVIFECRIQATANDERRLQINSLRYIHDVEIILLRTSFRKCELLQLDLNICM